MSWHPHTSTVVFSHWVEGLCVASTQVTVRDTEAVLRFLAASLPVETPTEAQGRLPRSTVGMEEVWEQASGPAAERRSEQA